MPLMQEDPQPHGRVQFLTWDELAVELSQHKIGCIMTVEQQEAVPAQMGTFYILLH